MLHQDTYFVNSVKLNFVRDRLIVLKIKIKFNVTDTDNELTECQTPRKKFQSIGISSVSLQAFMKTLKNNISEA